MDNIRWTLEASCPQGPPVDVTSLRTQHRGFGKLLLITGPQSGDEVRDCFGCYAPMVPNRCGRCHHSPR